jgi:hypothetical protein
MERTIALINQWLDEENINDEVGYNLWVHVYMS